MEEIIIKVDGREYKVFVEEKEDRILVHCGNDVYEVETKKEISSALQKIRKKEKGNGEGSITAPLPGIVYSIKVGKNDKVKKGQSLMTLMAMKMENDILATKDGRIKELNAKKDQSVNRGDVLIVIE